MTSQILFSRPSSRANGRAIATMIGAMGCFVLNDALVKHVSQSMPSAQLIFVRGVMASVLVLLVAHRLGALRQASAVLHPRVALRGGIDACATMMYLLALFRLPIANATAINLAAPLFMTVFAVLFLGERAGVARWSAVVLGFVGVLCVVQPSADGLNAWALLCLLGTLFHAARDLMTRRIDPAIPSIIITLATALAVTLLAGCLTLLSGWQAFALGDLALLGVAAAFLASGYFLLVQCMRAGEVSLTAPFRYVAVLFAMLLGYAVWNEVPTGWAWLGIALLVGSGLYMLHSERGRTRAIALDAQSE
ncbi:DMT family transporter [Variovorax sp. J2P1-59]|uniref:DMT family transporter n=1 Tax=Variovorax flavidus TaxID=3053501 RepID=UPI00257709BE|nr:DMT family transporter [Variovorax sp. J2P1-59]MDM0075113.1 DMT family transporter [Variovorax sp. J2P1-59]